ncbi:MAG: hypothetical protein AAF902_04205, partial [Chloroflexota bacterium]
AVILPFRPIKRCSMVNIHPDSAERDTSVLKAVNKISDNCFGVYCWPRQIGSLNVGDVIYKGAPSQ